MKKKQYLRSELFELLSAFSKSEIKKFGEFLDSPYHNKSQKLIKAFSFVKKFHPQFEDRKLKLENIHFAVNQGNRYNEFTVRNIISDLYQKAMLFLSVNGYLSKEQNLYDWTLSELKTKELYDLFNKYSNLIQPVLDGSKKWNPELFLERYRVNAHRAFVEQFMNFKKGQKKNFAKLFSFYDSALEDITVYYALQVILMYINVKLFESIHRVNIKETRVSQLIDNNILSKIRHLASGYISQNPLLLLLFNAYDTYEQYNDISRYEIYKDNFKKYWNQIGEDEQILHNTILYHYCGIKRKESKNTQYFTNEMLNFFRFRLANGLYRYGGVKYIDPMEFRAMITLSLGNGNYEWAANLTSNYLTCLESKFREPIKNLSMMYIHFYNNNFDLAMDFANKISVRLHYLKFDVINTKLRIYYENKKYESALDLIRSYGRTLEKTEYLSRTAKDRYSNFISVMKILIELNFQEKKVKRETALEKMGNKMENIAYLNWLTQKIDELTNSHNS